jgi:PAS domain S-box-containing protein
LETLIVGQGGDDLELQSAAERLKLALAAGQLGDWSWNPHTDRVKFGARGAEIFGLKPAEIITWEGLRNRLHPDDRDRARAAVLSALEQHSDYRTEYRITRPDGELVWVAAEGRGVYADDSSVLGMIGVVRDVTELKRAEELRNQLAAIVESSDDAIVSKSLDSIITTWNAGAERIFGYQANEVIGKSIRLLIPPERSSEEDVILSRLRQGERIEHFETVRVRKDGNRINISLSVSPVRDSLGNITGAAKIARDITDRVQTEKALREETKALELINESGTTLASSLELNTVLQKVTDFATQLSGAEVGAFFYNVTEENGDAYLLYTLSGAPREAFESFSHPRATPLFGPTFRGEAPIRIADVLEDPRYGQWAPHHGMPKGHLPVRSYLSVPVISRTGEVIGGLFFGHSSTNVFNERAERSVVAVASQAAIAIDNARLYENQKQAAIEREALLEAERAARNEAERMNVMKDEFVATLSHELRTPLNAILGWSQVLNLSEPTSSDYREGLEAIERNARAQTQLIDDLLDMSRIISGKIRLDVQWTNLSTAVEAAVESVRPSAEAKGIRLRTILDPHAGPVSGDPTRLQQIVWNLLSNAIKFTPKGGKVDVMLERVNSHLEITVHDSGIGIKPEFLPLVFERFRQADASTTRHFGGLGLGLSIVKQLVELHGGSVRAKSPGEGQGATFIVSLPLAPVRKNEVREHPATNRPGRVDCDQFHLAGLRVLVVDDELDARTLLQRVLEQCAVEVHLAANAGEAIDMIQVHRPDVLISDIGMPGEDGFELLRRIRGLPEAAGGRTPAIALTAFARSEDRTRAMIAGYQVHISKPIEAPELLATIASLAGRTGGG